MSNIETISEFISQQMDGQPIPASGSKDFEQLRQAVSEIATHKSGQELQMLAMHILRVVSDRVTSNLHAEKALLYFLSGGKNA